MIASSQMPASPSLFGKVMTFFVDHFVRSPLRGLAEIGEALAVLVPKLVKAVVAAVVEAVSAKLAPDRRQVQQELQRLLAGLQQLAWPVGVLVVVLLLQVPGSLWLLVLAALAVLFTLDREMKTARTA